MATSVDAISRRVITSFNAVAVAASLQRRMNSSGWILGRKKDRYEQYGTWSTVSPELCRPLTRQFGPALDLR
jgi:hypothetical protein